MKKTKMLVSLLVAALMALTIVLAACGHQHTFSDVWSSDETYHWHAATCEHTDEVADKAPHTWGSDGKCTVCSKDEAKYTYTSAFSISPSTWNPHQYKSTNDSVPLDYTTSGWYEFDYNEDHTGFELVPVLAEGDPEDVSALYAGEEKGWGIKEGETGRAFRIHLNKDAVWDNGEPITSADYVYSMQQLLSPELINYRASNYYQGQAGIVGARAYFYSGRSVWSPAGDVYETLAEAPENDILFMLGTSEKTGTSVSAVRAKWSTAFGDSSNTYPASTVAKNLGQLGFDYTSTGVSAELITSLEGKTLAEIKADTQMKKALDALVAWWKEYNKKTEDLTLDFFLALYTYPEADWDNVGFIDIDDYTIDWICMGTLEGFYIKYSLGNSFLVYEPLYNACKSKDPVTGVWSSSYGSSPDKYMGYGPYVMTNYIQDQIMEFKKSETWFGFTDKYADKYGTFEREIDGATVKQYQTTDIVLRYAKELTTREQMFLRGELVGLGLDDVLLAKYRTSRSLYYSQGATTFYGIISSDFDNLQAREAVLNGVSNYDPETYDGSKQQYNKTILTIKEFRQALAYGINREEIAKLRPGSTPGLSLISDAIISDPAAGVAFNSYDAAKAAVCEFWGVTWGEGGDFATLDAAYKALTGYNLEKAKALVDVAVDKAIEQGLMGANTTVRLEYGAASESETEVKWYETFKGQFENLMKGTKLEGKFIYEADYTLGSEFGDRIRTGNVDTAWGFGWSGGELDPYGLFEVYVDSAYNPEDGYQYDPWVNWSTVNLTINADIDGKGAKDYTYSVTQWFLILNGGEDVWHDGESPASSMAEGLPNWSSGKVPEEIRVEVLAKMQKAVLENYTTIPMMVDGGAQLKSYKITYGLETYSFFIGFGGLRFTTYNYSDVEWAAYVAQQGGILTY